MYNLETVTRPNISMLMGEDPAGVRMLEAFHKSLGRPECFLTYGDSFSLHVEKGQTLKEALTVADEDLFHPGGGIYDFTVEQTEAARHHVPKLLAQLR
jgi:hypothetical protein